MSKPTKNNDSRLHGSEYHHEAYGLLSVGRVSSRGTRLVGSDLSHHHYIRVSLKKAHKVRNHNRDWFHERGTIAEWNMSEHQWASFVSSMNQGNGVPVTLRYRPEDGYKLKMVEEIEEDNAHDLRQRELYDDLKELTRRLREMQTQMEKLADGKSIKKGDFKKVTSDLDTVINHICSNLPFNVEQHKEAMEKNVEAAKSDIEGYVTDMVTKLGIEKLHELAPTLEDHSDG